MLLFCLDHCHAHLRLHQVQQQGWYRFTISHLILRNNPLPCSGGGADRGQRGQAQGDGRFKQIGRTTGYLMVVIHP